MHFGSAIAGREVWMDTLMKKLDDDCFEVVLMAAGALGEVGIDGRALEALLNLKNSHYWQVRDAALKGLSRLVERRVISPSPDLLCRMAGFILTSTDFRPHFSIKETFNMIQKGCRDRLMIEEGLDASPLPSEKAAGKS
jgi:UDP-N-acetylglucosamine--N-acetylmuramyl-(pentapeptide) pyrophosphoryl-undecaprenol N-acetylglucosamine transferase